MRGDAAARAGADCAVVFGAMVLGSGPLWAKKAWGVYWTWDPRLTTTLLSVLVFVSVVMLRGLRRQWRGRAQIRVRFGGARHGHAADHSLRRVDVGRQSPDRHHQDRWWPSPSCNDARPAGWLRGDDVLLAALLLWCRTRLALSLSSRWPDSRRTSHRDRPDRLIEALLMTLAQAEPPPLLPQYEFPTRVRALRSSWRCREEERLPAPLPC